MALKKKQPTISDEELIRRYQKARDNLERLKKQQQKDKRDGIDSKMIRDRITETELELNTFVQELRKRGIQL